MSFGEQFENMVQEFVDNAIGEKDFSDDISNAIKDELPDFDDMITEKVRDYDFSDAIHDALRDYDFSDEVDKAMGEYDLTDAISETIDRNHRLSREIQYKVEETVNDFMESTEFSEKVQRIIVSIVWDVLTFKALRERCWGKVRESKVTVIKFTQRQINRFKKAA